MTIVTTISYLHRFFDGTQGGEASLDHIFQVSDRSHDTLVRNKMWLWNKTGTMRKFGLIKSIHKNGKLIALKITPKGKQALETDNIPDRNSRGSISGAQNSILYSELKNAKTDISVGEILNLIPKLQKENPDFKITFSITPKEV